MNAPLLAVPFFPWQYRRSTIHGYMAKRERADENVACITEMPFASMVVYHTKFADFNEVPRKENRH